MPAGTSVAVGAAVRAGLHVIVVAVVVTGTIVARAEPCADGQPTATGNFLGARFGFAKNATGNTITTVATQFLRGHVNCEDPQLAMTGLEVGTTLADEPLRALRSHAAAVATYQLPTLLGHFGVGASVGVGGIFTRSSIDWMAFVGPQLVAANVSIGLRYGLDSRSGSFMEADLAMLIPFDGYRPGKFW